MNYATGRELREAAQRTAADLMALHEIPAAAEQYPSTTDYLPEEAVFQLSDILRADRYAYASALGTSALRQLVSYQPGANRPERTARLHLVTGVVPATFATGLESGNPYMQFADRLQASYQAAADRFSRRNPDKATWMETVYNNLLEFDPSQAYTRHRLTAQVLRTGIEGPPEMGSFLQCMHQVMARDRLNRKPEPTSRYSPELQRDISHDIIAMRGVQRASFSVTDLRRRPLWCAPASRNELYGIKLSRTELLRRESAGGQTQYLLDVDGQFTHPRDNNQPIPRLQCPIHFIKADVPGRKPSYLELFMHGAINEAYELGLFDTRALFEST